MVEVEVATKIEVVVEVVEVDEVVRQQQRGSSVP